MEFNIPFGKQTVNVFLPDKNVISFNAGKGTKAGSGYKSDKQDDLNEHDIVMHAIKNPVQSPTISSLSYKKNNACILASDITRPCPSNKFLPHLISELKKGGVRTIKVIFGLGIHRQHTAEEKLKLAGESAAEDCMLLDSGAGRFIDIGKTSYSTPVEISEHVLSSDFIIATGNIEYHYFAGYSGGAKALMPGVCSYNSICANHSMMLEDMAAAGEFEKNPLRQDIEEAGRMAGIDFIFNVILDDSKRIIGAVAGKNNEAFIEGIKTYDAIYEVSSPEKADIILVSAGGFPKDINLYQAQKALESVKNIVKDGGIIILVARCMEGFGEERFEEWMHYTKDFESIYGKLKQKFVLGGHKAVAVSRLLTLASVMLYSDFDKTATRNMGFEKICDIQGFINESLKSDGDLRIAVVPNGRFIKYCPL